MTNYKYIFLLIFCSAIFWACNPDCDSLIGVSLSSTVNAGGHQVLISAQPSSALEGRRVFFDDKEVETNYIQDRGLVVTVPEDVSGDMELRIEDPDCVDFIAFNFEVVNEAYFVNNPTYVFPPTPEIIIPNLPADFPPSIENAWLHPVNTDYCFWFKFLPDMDGKCTKFIDPVNSFEQSTCGSDSELYSNNPLSGRVEADGSVFVTVNRPGGTEDFEGALLSPGDVPEKYQGWVDITCGGNAVSTGWDNGFKNRDFMMLLTSKSTGRQLLIYQQGVPGAPIDCL